MTQASDGDGLEDVADVELLDVERSVNEEIARLDDVEDAGELVLSVLDREELEELDPSEDDVDCPAKEDALNEVLRLEVLDGICEEDEDEDVPPGKIRTPATWFWSDGVNALFAPV